MGDSDRYHIGKMLINTLQKFSGNVNQIDEATGESETNASILKRSIQLAIWFRKNGVQKGDVIFVTAANHLDLCIPVIAAMYIGAAILPVDKNLNHLDMKHALGLGTPRLIFCDPDKTLKIIEEILGQTNLTAEVIVFGTNDCNYKEFRKLLDASEDEIRNFKPTELDPNEVPALIICTSGSTGKPKGVVLTHKGVIGRIHGIWLNDGGPVENELILAMSSLHWYTASVVIFACCIYGVPRVQTSNPFSPDAFFRIMNKYRPTRTILSPAAVMDLMAHPNSSIEAWSSMRYLLLTGSSLGQESVASIQNKLINGKVVNVYAMTEACGLLACQIFERSLGKIAVGKIKHPVNTKIVDLEGRELGPNQPGELLIKGEFMLKGYYNNETATKDAFTEDGWFKTGDILYQDEEGLFYFVDRIKMMMKYKANQISPSELEDVILQHPGVAMTVVERLEIPPDDLPVALIVKKPDVRVTAQEVKDLLSDNLAPYKQLHGGVAFVESLPILATGKFDRKAIREIIKTIKTE